MTASTKPNLTSIEDLAMESDTRHQLRCVFARLVREAHELTTDDDMTTEQAISALRFIDGNLDDLEELVSEFVIDRLVNNQ